MDNFELDKESMQLADRHSAYMLAKMLLIEHKERNQLAAHVEHMHMVWVDAKRCVSVVAFPSLYHVEQYQSLAKASIKKLESAFAEQPATTLARRDLIKQAEILEKLYDDTARHVVINRGAVIDIARSLRNQASQLEADQ